MAENRGNLGKETEQRTDQDAPPEKADSAVKQQSGRSPARPPYEQYLRVSKVLK
jgi:hypothetical protein